MTVTFRIYEDFRSALSVSITLSPALPYFLDERQKQTHQVAWASRTCFGGTQLVEPLTKLVKIDSFANLLGCEIVAVQKLFVHIVAKLPILLGPLAGLSGRSQSFEVNTDPRLASSPVGLSNRKVSFFTPKLCFLPDKLARGAISLIATCATNFKTFVPVG